MPNATAISPADLDARAIEVIDAFGGMDFVQDPEEENFRSPTGEPFLYVEESRYDSDLYVARFDSLDTAASYRDSQECPEDWAMKAVVDLRTGERFEPRVTTAFVPETYEPSFEFDA